MCVESGDLSLILVLLGLVGIDSALYILSLRLQSSVAGLQSGLVAVNKVDLVVKFDVIGIQKINLLSNVSDILSCN